jgi:hypothetical protein
MIAEAVGLAKTMRRQIHFIELSRQFYALLWAGGEILSQKPLPSDHEITFEGIPIRQGTIYMIDRIRVHYTVSVAEMKAKN